MGVHAEWRGAPRGERHRSGAAQSAAAHTDERSDRVLRLARAQAVELRVGAILRGPQPAPIPQALLPRPHLPPQGIRALSLRAHVRHRRQESRALQGRRHVEEHMLIQ